MNKKVKHIITMESIEHTDRGLVSFERIYIPDNCFSLDLALNKISNLSELRSLPFLRNLNLDHNCIKSFRKVQHQPCLKWISLKHNPIMQNKYFRIACLIVFGSQLSTINGEAVTDMQREKADTYREKSLSFLLDGCMISSLHPLKLVNIYEKKQKVSYLSKVPSFAITSQKIIDNEYKLNPKLVKHFVSIIKQIRTHHSYGIPKNIHRKRREAFKPKLPEFVKDNDSASFQGDELQYVILPNNMKLSSDSYTYSEAFSSSSSYSSSSSSSDESDETIASDHENPTTT